MYRNQSLKPLLVAIASAGMVNIAIVVTAHAGITTPTTSVAIRAPIEQPANGSTVKAPDKAPTRKKVKKSQTPSVANRAPIFIGSVSAVLALNTLNKVPTKRQVFNSTQSVKVIGRKEIETAGPAGGASQVLAIAPGVNTETDSGAGASRGSISINGMKTGWSNIAGNSNDGTVMVTFDGVPMIDPAYGVWGSPEVPQMSLIKGIAVTYGPGYPINRWYNNIGGAINFIPLQPSARAGASISGFFGSFNTRGVHFNVNSGNLDGWSAILAGGVTSSNNYLTGYGFDNPSNNYAYFAKVIKHFHGGHISFGAYVARGVAYRPLGIPVTPNPQVTVNGYNANGVQNPGPIYSQATTGFYTTLPYSVYWKEAFNTSYLLYTKFYEHLSRHLTVHNLLFYRNGNRKHLHYDNYGFNAGVLDQYYLAKSNTYGDKLYLTAHLPWNTVSFGGYFVNNKYSSLLDFYNPEQIATYSSLSPNAGNNVIINGVPVYNSFSLPNAFHSSYLYMTDLAAFIQDDIQPLPNLRITPGLRVVTFQTNFVNNAAAQFPVNVADLIGHNGDYQPNSSTNFTDVEPSIGANWKIVPDVAIYANYSTAYKAPSGATGTYAHLLVSTLKPQSSSQYQFGVKAYIPHDALLNRASLGANYYHLDDTNEIIPIPVVSHLYSEFASGSSTFSGVNLYFEDNPLYNLHVFTNLSFERAVYSNYVNPHGVSYDGLPISNVPARTANVGADYEYYHAGIVYEPSLWWQYTGQQNIYNNNIGAPSTQKLPAFGIWNVGLNINVGHQYLFAVLHRVTIKLDILNLLNKQYNSYEYITSGGYYNVPGQLLAEPGMPRAFYINLDWHW